MLVSNNTPQVSYTGTFRFPTNEKKAQSEILGMIKNGKQVFHNVLEQGDFVLVTRSASDIKTANYVKSNKINGVEYYPNINTKSGLDEEEPQKLINLIKSQADTIIKNMDEVIEKATKLMPKKYPKDYKVKREIATITDALRLNVENPEINYYPSHTHVRDYMKKRTIEIITPQKGTNYVYLKPDSLNEPSTRCIIDGKGNILKTYNTPTEIVKFAKTFKNLKKSEKNVLTIKDFK